MGMGQALSYHSTAAYFPWDVSFIAHICRIHLSSKEISPCTVDGHVLVGNDMIDLPGQWLHLEGEDSSGLNCLYFESKANDV